MTDRKYRFDDYEQKIKDVQKKAHNMMIGEYIEKGWTFVRSEPALGSAVFYKHENNERRDDILFLKVNKEKESILNPPEERIFISKKQLLEIADKIRDVPTHMEK